MTERGTGQPDESAFRRRAQGRSRSRPRGFDHFARIAYDGRPFAGFARQPGRPTVEGSLLGALSSVVPGLRRWGVGGRTDRGVSATGQVVSFRGDAPIPEADVAEAIDAATPGQIICLRAGPAPRGFHAQFWAEERRYTYLMPAEDPVLLALAPLLDRMLARLQGRRCFSAFARQPPAGKNTVRTLRRARCRVVHAEETPVLGFELSADGFLRKLVRVLVATAVAQAKRGADEDILVRLGLEGKRSATGRPAAPEPLALTSIRYSGWSPP